jgi:hypothetical protein
MKRIAASLLLAWMSFGFCAPVFAFSVDEAKNAATSAASSAVDTAKEYAGKAADAASSIGQGGSSTTSGDSKDGGSSTASSESSGGPCSAGSIGNVSDCLDSYKPKGALSVGDGVISGNGGVKSKVTAIANRVIAAAALASIAAIVFAGFHMVTAYGDDEQHKKGKESLKWGIIGFAVSLLSFALVNAVVNFFYSVGG